MKIARRMHNLMSEKTGRLLVIILAVTNLIGLSYYSQQASLLRTEPTSARDTPVQLYKPDAGNTQGMAPPPEVPNLLPKVDSSLFAPKADLPSLEIPLVEQVSTMMKKLQEIMAVMSESGQTPPQQQQQQQRQQTQDEVLDRFPPRLVADEKRVVSARAAAPAPVSAAAPIKNNGTVPGVLPSGSDEMKLVFPSRLNSSFQARPMYVSSSMMERLGLLHPVTMEIPDELTLDEFAILTASNNEYFYMLQDEIGCIHSKGFKNKIYIYDLGLAPKFLERIRAWCNVELLTFDFDAYPPHFRELRTYAWKPIAIALILKQHAGVIWFDSSVRLKSNVDVQSMLDKLRSVRGALSLTTSGTSVYYPTHPVTLEYLPTSTKALMSEHMRESTFIFYRTETVMKDILRWMVACALTQECIAPSGSDRMCHRLMDGTEYDAMENRGDCHRFDQSVINTIMLDLHGNTRVFFEGGDFAEVRGGTGIYNVTLCT